MFIEGDSHETLTICRNLAIAPVAFRQAIAEKLFGRFTIRSRTPVVKREPGGRLATLNRMAPRSRPGGQPDQCGGNEGGGGDPRWAKHWRS
jgi:hypothetical protein